VSANAAGMSVNVVNITATIIAMMIVEVTTITIITKQKIPHNGGIFLFSGSYQPSASPTSK
jgi:cell division protein FtsN